MIPVNPSALTRKFRITIAYICLCWKQASRISIIQGVVVGILVRVFLQPAGVHLEEATIGRVVVPRSQEDKAVAVGLFSCVSQRRLCRPRLGIPIAIRVEGLGQTHGAGRIDQLAHRSQPVIGEVLGGRAVGLGQGIEAVPVAGGDVGGLVGLGEDHGEGGGGVEDVGGRAVAGQVAERVVLPQGLGAIAGAAGIGIDAGDLVGAVDDVADSVDCAGGGVPLVEAQQVAPHRCRHGKTSSSH